MITPVGLNWKFLDQHLVLLPQKALFWKEHDMLIVADVHFGKTGHFRKAGIAVPKLMEQEDLATLSDIISEHRPARLLFLGDLFHSEINNDWEWLMLWRDLYPDIEMILVRGNHDILHDEYYAAARFRVLNELEADPFIFSHEPLNSAHRLYPVSGHIHPGVLLRGKGRQFVTLPSFSFLKQQALLPAFGKFTGNISLQYSATDHVFGVLKHKVIQLS